MHTHSGKVLPIILIWFAAQETLLFTINVENSNIFVQSEMQFLKDSSKEQHLVEI